MSINSLNNLFTDEQLRIEQHLGDGSTLLQSARQAFPDESPLHAMRLFLGKMCKFGLLTRFQVTRLMQKHNLTRLPY